MSNYFEGRQINFICKIHALTFTQKLEVEDSEIANEDKVLGTCDICVHFSGKDSPQTVYKVEAYGGLRKRPQMLVNNGKNVLELRTYSQEEIDAGVDKDEAEAEKLKKEIFDREIQLKEKLKKIK